MHRHQPAAQIRRRPAGVAVGGDDHVARGEGAEPGGDGEASPLAFDGSDRRVGHGQGAGGERAVEQALVIEPRVEAAVAMDDAAAVVGIGSYLAVLLGTRHHVGLDTDVAAQQLGLARQRLVAPRRVGAGETASADEAAIDALALD